MEEDDDDEDGDQKSSKRRGMEIITFTEEQAAELAKDPGEEASVSERILAQSAAERDRISEIKDKAVELETEPKFANCCSFCPKSFKKPSDLVRYMFCLFTHKLGLLLRKQSLTGVKSDRLRLKLKPTILVYFYST